MATLNLGRIKPVFRGAYNNATAYVVDDIVTFGDETFICILASTGNATSNATYWTKLAAKGTDGTDVGTTITTQGDILYRDGSGLQRLGAGTSGQFLKTLGTGANPAWATVTTKVIGATRFHNNTRTSLPNQANHVWWSVSHTKTSSTSFLFVQGQATMQGSYSDQIGEYVEYNSVKNYSGIRHNMYGDGVSTDWNSYHANNLAAGTYDLKLGWSVANSSSQRPADMWNPNASDDARDHQTGTEMIVWEIEN
tara:strand:- start:319 stop:1074 length:756 start_codon:yes stop_codon:yes gene_type:complete